ncbi:MAG: hypothetical protein EOO39_01785 [Cytophagaceae bacterium]|nr:MAG: hypothetical protein EOO39_01785 [Cytophagaceae bacterium]
MSEPIENSDQLIPGSRRNHPIETFSEDFLMNACANFKELITTPAALLDNAGNFVRAIYLPVSEVQKVLAETQGDHVKLYYGVMGDMNGKHFIFMAPGNAPEVTIKPSKSVGLLAGNLMSEAEPVTFTAAVPECIGKIPPCPPIEDQFIQ